MPRKLRVEYSGAVYHVMNRGDRREPIFKDDQDRRLFLDTLDEGCRKADWEVHAWCLMPNHFHLVVETPRGNLVGGMKWFLGTYTARFDRHHKLFGHLFSGRYKALVVDGSGNGYLKTVCNFVHLNPARARLLGENGIPKDSPTGRQQWAARMEQRRAAEDGRDYQTIRRGWCFGEQTFRKELLEQMAGHLGEHHFAEERGESSEAKARGILAAELKRLGWTNEELKRRRKGDQGKVRIARRLRAETTMTLKWIATRLHLGSWTHVSNLLSRASPKRH